jgi:CubicO group peptidase (beta-lactamase class C family)
MAKTAIALLAILLISAPILSRADEPKAAASPALDVDPFPRAEPAKLGINTDALEKLRKRAEEANSDALVIIKDSQLVADWDFGKPRGPIEVMSATRSVIGLAIGRLIDAGKIKSVDPTGLRLLP